MEILPSRSSVWKSTLSDDNPGKEREIQGNR